MSKPLAQLTNRSTRRKGESAKARSKVPRMQFDDECPVECVDAARSHAAKLKAHQLRLLRAAGLFDDVFYVQAYPDIRNVKAPLIEHYFDFGEGRRPNAYFDAQWYWVNYPDAKASGMHPLVHYLLHGERSGYQPGPFFNPIWYRRNYKIAEGVNALGHYLTSYRNARLSPIPEFDAEYYSRNTDVLDAGLDLFQHFLHYGFREFRNPSADFDVKSYSQRHLNNDMTKNPLIHYIEHRHDPKITGKLANSEVTVSREIKKYLRPSAEFEHFEPIRNGLSPRALILAYFLPQFHTIPENDTWWGKGFTEWTNLSKGSPRYIGHYQPRVPRDLGFYDLGSATMRPQIELAKAAGLHGFIFYYYWFNGRRLMERPINHFLSDPSLQLPFALMWANENWTRRWDGADSEVLISQDYRSQDDFAFVTDLARHFKDDRYIRIHDRPLLFIYRMDIIPCPDETIRRWRQIFEREFNERPLFIMAQTFGSIDPRLFGLDGAIEFPPHKLTTGLPPNNGDFNYLDLDFEGKIYHYESVMSASLDEAPPDYPLIKTAVPSWDNDARQQGSGISLAGSSPSKYQLWLSELIDMAREAPFHGKAIVCINAWNEWCEGAYLEPDLHYGSAYLNATVRALIKSSKSVDRRRVLLVGHDAFPSGAQHLLMNIGSHLAKKHGFLVHYLLLGAGKLLECYEAEGPVTVADGDQIAHAIRLAARQGYRYAIINTSASARIAKTLADNGFRSILLVHELPEMLKQMGLLDIVSSATHYCERVVFAADVVRRKFESVTSVRLAQKAIIRPQGCYKDLAFSPADRLMLRRKIGLGSNDKLIVGAGYADLRKGFDLFLATWRHCHTIWPGDRLTFVWVGDIDPDLREWLASEIKAAELSGTFVMLGYQENMQPALSAADAFLLTSREDPFPTIVLEALRVGLFVLAFDGIGGAPELLRSNGEGVVVPFGDLQLMADQIHNTLNKGTSTAARRRRTRFVNSAFDFTEYAWFLSTLLMPDLKVISVISPNYNYGRYMHRRLRSIFAQTYPLREIVVIDDRSTDDSIEIINRTVANAGRNIELIVSKSNSGSAFKQWAKGVEIAKGEFVWIAEADDEAESDFVERLVGTLVNEPTMAFAFSDSRVIDACGRTIRDDYKEYYRTLSPRALQNSCMMDGKKFVRELLAVKNIVLNASSVVWRKSVLNELLHTYSDELSDFKVAGDWFLYLRAALLPSTTIGYEAFPLSIHRRHFGSITSSLNKKQHLYEIKRCQEIAARQLSLSSSVRTRQKLYLEEISREFGAQVSRIGPKGRA